MTAAFDKAVSHNAKSQEMLSGIHRGSEQWHGHFQADWVTLTQLMSDQSREMHARLVSQRKCRKQGFVLGVINDRAHSTNRPSADLEKAMVTKSIALKQVQIEKYAKIWEMFSRATGIGQIEELIEAFQDQEEESFRLFMQVNDLSKQRERAMTEASPMAAELAVRSENGKDGEMAAKLREMERELADLTETEDGYLHDLQQISDLVCEMVSGLNDPSKIFTLGDGLVILETHVFAVISAFKHMLHVEAESADTEAGYEEDDGICLGVIPIAESFEDEEECSLPRKSQTISADNARNMVRAIAQDLSPRR